MELHESIKPTLVETVIKETKDFRLRLEKHHCSMPVGTISVNLINECLDKEGTVWQSSTYNFCLTEKEIQHLCYCLGQ